MPLILAIEPDERQASILSSVVMTTLHADFVLVASKDAALSVIGRKVPDLVLLTTLLSPRDEQEVLARLRALDEADHLQTLTIPLLGTSGEEEESSGGFLGAFRRKRAASKPRRCDPRLFAKEVRSYLKRAEEIKAERRAMLEAYPMPAPAAAPAGTPPPATEAKARPVVDPWSWPAHAPIPPPRPAPAPMVEPLVVAPSPVEVPLVDEPAAPAVPAVVSVTVVPRAIFATLVAAQALVERAMRAVDRGDDTDADELAALMRELKVPLRVAAFAYPRGCRIGQVRLGRPAPGKRRATPAPPPVTRSPHLAVTA